MPQANRILHAIQPSSPTTKNWRLVYEPIMPINSLVSYPFLKCSELKKSLERLKRIRDVTKGKILAIDCGVYTWASKLIGVNAQMSLDYRESLLDNSKGIDNLDDIRQYVVEYGEFLSNGYEYYDYAFDFDADAFLPIEEVDKLSKSLFEIVGSNRLDKIARVYHTIRPNVNQWWDSVCADNKFNYVAIEGGALHRKSEQFYPELIETAHKYGKKVHILAVSGEDPPKMFPADYMDTSAHRLGGHKAQMQTPWGSFSAGKAVRKNHILLQPPHIRTAVEDWLQGYGYSLEQMTETEDEPNPEAQYYRTRLNIQFINDYWDKPYVPRSKSERLF